MFTTVHVVEDIEGLTNWPSQVSFLKRNYTKPFLFVRLFVFFTLLVASSR